MFLKYFSLDKITRRAAALTLALNLSSFFISAIVPVQRGSSSCAVVEEITMSFPASTASLKARETEPAYIVAPFIIMSSVIMRPL